MAVDLPTDRIAILRRLASRRPRLLLDYLKWSVVGRLRLPQPVYTYQPIADAVAPEAALATIVQRAGAWTDGPAVDRLRESLRQTMPAATIGGHSCMAGDTSLGELVYALLRVAKPTLTIETGVATGVTSSFALAALADNGAGVLTSIDLPPLAFLRERRVGCNVPPELRGRWRYHWGPSSRLLPPLLRRAGDDLGVFIHDSDHSYATMHWELTVAYPKVQPGGWLVADDANLHQAFADFAQSVGVEPIFVVQPDKPGCTGLLQKPG